MLPHRRPAPGLGALATFLVSTAAAAAQERAFVVAPLLDEGALALFHADDGAETLTYAGAIHHPVGTRGASSVLLHPVGTFAYVVQAEGATEPAAVSLHRVDPRTGRLEFRSLVHTASSLGSGPLAVTLDRDGRHAYVAEWGRRTLRTFDIDGQTGAWRERHTPMPTGDGPSQVLCDPTSRFLFVLNQAGCSVSRYRLDERGRPELAGEDVLLNGSAPVAATLSPDGEHFYVTLETWDLVLAMAIDGRDGGLRTINAAATGARPSGLVYSVDLERLYVAERDSRSISAFDLDAETGRLGPRLGPFAAGGAPTQVAVCAGGDALWVSGDMPFAYGFELDGTAAAVPGSIRPVPGRLGALVGLDRPPAGEVVALDLRCTPDGALELRPAAAPSPSAHSRPPNVPAAQVLALPETPDELTIDPCGAWFTLVTHRPGRIRLCVLGPEGTASEPGPALDLAPVIAATAAHPSGRFLAVATRTPPAVHLLELDRRAGTFTQVHAVPLQATPDRITFDPTGRRLCVAQPSAERILVFEVDEFGYFGSSHASPVPGRPGPLAVASDGSFVYVGLVDEALVLPCSFDEARRGLVPRPALAVTTVLRPRRVDVAGVQNGLLVETVDADGAFGELRFEAHPLTGALQAVEAPVGIPAEATAPRSDTSARPAVRARMQVYVPRADTEFGGAVGVLQR